MEKLAIFGGNPLGPAVPVWPVRDAREEQAVVEVVRSSVYGGYPEPGPHAARFAADFAAMHDSAYGIACARAAELGSYHPAAQPAGAAHLQT